MKLTGIITIGTFYCPWFPYGLASFYFCDEIIVVNGGFDLKSPQKSEFNIPLKQVSRDISDLDVDGKVYEWTGWTLKDLKHPLILATEKIHPPTPLWVDMRGLGLTLALEKAVERGADWILKWDSDQVGYKNTVLLTQDLLDGYLFKQHEFAPNVYHLADPQPDSPFNDTVYTFKADPQDFFGGGGAPHIRTHRKPSVRYWCAHLRSANPIDLSISEKYDHFYGRCWFRLYTNQGLWGKELQDKSSASANAMLGIKGKPSPIPPPEVCKMKPLEYIEEVIKGV